MVRKCHVVDDSCTLDGNILIIAVMTTLRCQDESIIVDEGRVSVRSNNSVGVEKRDHRSCVGLDWVLCAVGLLLTFVNVIAHIGQEVEGFEETVDCFWFLSHSQVRGGVVVHGVDCLLAHIECFLKNNEKMKMRGYFSFRCFVADTFPFGVLAKFVPVPESFYALLEK